MIATAEVQCLLSTITVAELLVKPFQSGQAERVELCERFLLSLPETEFVSPDYVIARDAARIRAEYHVRTPDAILLATALTRESAFLSNDRALKRLRLKTPQIVILDDFV